MEKDKYDYSLYQKLKNDDGKIIEFFILSENLFGYYTIIGIINILSIKKKIEYVLRISDYNKSDLKVISLEKNSNELAIINNKTIEIIEIKNTNENYSYISKGIIVKIENFTINCLTKLKDIPFFCYATGSNEIFINHSISPYEKITFFEINSQLNKLNLNTFQIMTLASLKKKIFIGNVDGFLIYSFDDKFNFKFEKFFPEFYLANPYFFMIISSNKVILSGKYYMALINSDTLQIEIKFSDPGYKIRGLFITLDDKMLFAPCTDESFRIFDLNTFKEIKKYEKKHDNSIGIYFKISNFLIFSQSQYINKNLDKDEYLYCYKNNC